MKRVSMVLLTSSLWAAGALAQVAPAPMPSQPGADMESYLFGVAMEAPAVVVVVPPPPVEAARVRCEGEAVSRGLHAGMRRAFVEGCLAPLGAMPPR